jgi:hypothetical protein
MPLTWFAHQLPVLGMKVARPRWFDATALCIGSMTPDLMYAFSRMADIDTHRWPAALRYGVPMATVMALLTRHVVAPMAAPQLPDLGVLRLRSYAVLARRRPHLAATIACALAGVASHVLIDSFTHDGRDGTRWLGYDDMTITAFGHTEPLSRLFQFIGHVGGTIGCILLLRMIGRRRLLDAWYGADAVGAARAWQPTRAERIWFWSCVAATGALGLVWGAMGGRMEVIQRPALAVFAGAVLGSIVTRRAVRPDVATALR